jgi:mannose-6-phosphate isomerase-like protein (cupin superfamily)
VPAGVTTRLHSLTGITERYFVRGGHGIVEVGGVGAGIGPGDLVVIGPGVTQRVTAGSDWLEFYCLCQPRFVPEAYVDREPA